MLVTIGCFTGVTRQPSRILAEPAPLSPQHRTAGVETRLLGQRDLLEAVMAASAVRCCHGRVVLNKRDANNAPERRRDELAARLRMLRERVATNGAQAQSLSERVRRDRELLMMLLDWYHRWRASQPRAYWTAK